LDVRAIVTTGPAVDPATLPSTANVVICRSAPHSHLLPEAALMVTHAGHGTVIRSLAAGVPLLCLPMGRDQNDNAARVVARGVGLRLKPTASEIQIREAVRRIIASPQFREKAQALGRTVTEDAQNSPAIDILEHVAAGRVH